MTKSKISALLSLTIVFLSGLVLGAFGYRLYSAPTVQVTGSAPPSQSRPSPEEVRKKIVADLTGKLKLDAEQLKQLNGIMDETHDEYEQLREKSKPEWDALNEKRKALEDKYKPERDAIGNRQVEKVNAMLREDQRPIYAAWRAERERQRKARDQHDQHKK
jgi:hypothetical protein